MYVIDKCGRGLLNTTLERGGMWPAAGGLQSHGIDRGWDVPAILLWLQQVLGPAGLLSGRLVQNARWKHQTFTNVIIELYTLSLEIKIVKIAH